MSNSISNITIVGGGSSYTTDTITIDPLSWNSLTSSTGSYTIGAVGSSNMGTVTLTGGGYTLGTGVTVLDSINTTSNWNLEEFVNCMPDLQRIEDMCKKYPALEIAFRNFKTIYKLVKDDYDNPVPKE